ncbi:MAG: hypothetical protein ACREI5_03445 [Candidatus Methylomirabilales bacterium]
MLDLILPLSIVMSLLSYSLITNWYVMPALTSTPREKALTALLLLHSFRHIGMAFLIPGVTSKVLDPRFANPAAYGDLLAALLALLAIMALRLRWAAAIPFVWIFNIEGSLDLLNALYRGFRHTPDAHLGATYFIPAVIVPGLLVTHFIVFKLLLRPEATHGES